MIASQEISNGLNLGRRTLQRRKVLKAARITANGGVTYVPCTMREISEMGARLQVYEGHIIPAWFDLVVEIDGMRAACEVMWRTAGEIGVRFRSLPVSGKPLRLQVVVPSHSTASAAGLRRRPLTH